MAVAIDAGAIGRAAILYPIHGRYDKNRTRDRLYPKPFLVIPGGWKALGFSFENHRGTIAVRQTALMPLIQISLNSVPLLQKMHFR